MPSSATENRQPILDEISRFPHEKISILDVGIGFGEFGKLIRERFPTRRIRLFGVEVWEKYRNSNWEYYDEVFVGDLRDVVPSCGRYDIILAVDVLQQLSKEEGIEVLHLLREKAREFVLVSVPIIYLPQGAYGGNPYEEHKTHWRFDEMFALGSRPLFKGQVIGVFKFESLAKERLRQEALERLDPSRKLKILWFSISPFTQISFSVQSNCICRGLSRLGHKVWYLGWDYYGESRKLEGYQVLPFQKDRQIQDVIQAYHQSYDFDVVVTLGNIERYFHLIRNTRIPTLHWFQICTDPVLKVFVNTYMEAELVPMSAFAVELLKPYKRLEKGDIIPHCVDTEVHRPLDRAAVRADCGLLDIHRDLTDRFVVGYVARNSREKQLPRMLEAFGIFARGRSDVLLLLRTEKNGAWNIDQLIDLFELEEKCLVVDQYLDEQEMNIYYNLLDVYASASAIEGFGIPVIEAMACGIPIIANKTGGMTEVVRDAGIIVDRPTRYIGSHECYYDYLVNIERLAEALDEVYRAPEWRQTLAARSQEKADSSYSVKRVVERWQDLLLRRVALAETRVPLEEEG